MKKKLVMILMAVMVASATLGGCGQKGAETGTSVSAEEEDVQISYKELMKATDYKVQKYVKLNDYMNMTVELSQDYSITDEQIQEYIEYLLSMYPEYETTDKTTVENGDIVNIDYVGKVDGEEFNGGSATGQHLEIGSGSFIDGFEDGLVGAVKGDQKDLNLTFPDPYPKNPDLAGKAVVFEVTVNAVKERSVPELTDEFVASVSPDDGTVEKYRESTRENLLEQKQLSIDNQRDTDILNAVVDNSEVVCSTASIDEAYDTQLKAYTNMLSSYGVDLATYAGMIGSDEDSFKQEIRQEAKEMAKQSLVLNEIAKQENITIDDSDKEALAKRYGYESLKTMLQNDNIDQKMVDDTALMQKTLDFLVENAKITVSTEENNAALNTEAAEDEAE